MSKKIDKQGLFNMIRVGNYTKNAVENFEESIVNKKNYLEKVKNDDETKMSNKFH